MAGILSVIFLFSGISADLVYAKKTGKDRESIEISSAEEFLAFAVNCHSDKWSKGKTVNLTGDIDLTGTEFEMIPVFAGTFDGNGNTIRGLRYSEGKYVAGLFRYITEDATVKNLTLEAKITSTDEQQCVGGICGENSGMIENCKFYGSVEGRSETGGIAGSNTAKGTIRKCESKGVVTGMYDTGGIVGKNHGLVTRCTNRAGVNNSKEWIKQEDESGLDWLKTIQNEEESISLQSGVDTGGIAGYSDGAVSFCKNKAVIGYEHTGYNIGGIAGRQAGLLSLCENSGEVYGRKDVGGIVGQMEPYIKMNEVDSVEEEVKKLHDLISRLLDDVDASKNTVSGDFKALKNSADAALDTSHTIAGQVTDFVDDNVDAVNELADRIKYVIDALPEIQKNVTDAVSVMSVINKDLKKINNDLAIIEKMKDTPYAGTSYERLSLVSSVGGELVADNSSPAQGVNVTLTAKPQDGYRVDAVSAFDADGTAVAVSKGSGQTYTLTMPEKNVIVQAVFSYAGKYMAKSNAGGRITLSETDDKVTVKAYANADYTLEGLTVDHTPVAVSTGAGLVFTHEIKKADYPLNGRMVIIEGTFKNAEASPDNTSSSGTGDTEETKTHSVTVLASVGGRAYTDVRNAKKDDTVTVTVLPESGYQLKAENPVMVNNQPCRKEDERHYTFIMPGDDAVVTVSFEHSASNTQDVICESTPGGQMTATEMPGSDKNRYLVTVTPDSGYLLRESGALCVYAKADSTGSPLLTVPRSGFNAVANGYTYTLDLEKQISGYQNQKPLLLYTSFESDVPRHNIRTLMATGGTAAVDAVSAGKNTSVRITARASKGYRLESVTVTGKSAGMFFRAGAGSDTYEFLMPDEDVTVAVEFSPVAFAMVSNVGGSADYSIDGTKITLSIQPAAGYSLTGAPVVKDSAGNSFAVAKQKSNEEEYMVDITGASGLVTAKMEFGTQNQYDALKSALETMESSSGRMQDAMNRCKLLVDEISGILTEADGSPKDWGSISKPDRETVAKDIIELARQLSIAGSAASKMAGSISVVFNITQEYALDTIEKLHQDIDVLNTHVQDLIACLDAAAAAVTSVTDYLSMQSAVRFTQLGDEFDNNLDILYENLLDISSRLQQMEQDINAAADTMIRDFRAINDQLNVVLLLFVDRIDQMKNPDTSDYFKDVSDEDIDGAKTGKVKGCTNYGVVEGDINIGGVAGSMAVDEEEPEDNAAGTSQLSLGAVYQTSCILQSSRNYGYVKAKKDGAGGVAGFMKLGVVTECEAYGEVKSTEGDYAGGICGDSVGVIRKSFALCTVRGGSYVGGITGYGEGIYNCCAMVDAGGEGSRIGAIAGQVGERNEEGSRSQSDYAKDNYYVGDELYGIDNISYVGVAEPVTYKKLLGTEGLPDDYRHLKVSYIVDGECVKEQELAYGDALDTLKMPKLPDKDGQNGIWPDVRGEVMTSNRVLEAEYVDDITVLESEEMAETKTVRHPCAFVEGTFTGKAKLNARLLPSGAFETPEEGVDAQVYEIKLANTRLGASDESKLRLWSAYGSSAAVYQYTDSGWKQLKSKGRGGYLQVSVAGTDVVLAVVDIQKTKIWIYVACAVAVAALIAIFIVIYRKKQKRHAPKQKKTVK